MRELAVATGHSRHLLCQQLRKFGIKQENAAKPLAPFGWDLKGRELVKNAKEQIVLVEILRLRKLGLGPKTIATKLNSRGTPSKTGGRWGHSSVQNILRRAESKKTIK